MAEDPGVEVKPTRKSVLLGGLIAIFVGGGSGFGLGYLTGAPAPSQTESRAPDISETENANTAGPTNKTVVQDHAGSKTDTTAATDNHPNDAQTQTYVTALDPIVTNLSDPKDMWVRLELVVTSDSPLGGEVTNQIHQDLFSHIRAMRLSEMAGPSAFIDLKAELLARARQRSEDHVQKIYVKTLLYE